MNLRGQGFGAATRTGRYNLPSRRGENLVLAGASGSRFVKNKPFEDGIGALACWAIGATTATTTITNLVPNPSFRASSTTLTEVSRNKVNSPRGTNAASLGHYTLPTGVTLAANQTVSGNPDGITTGARLTVASSAPAGAGIVFTGGSLSGWRTASMWVKRTSGTSPAAIAYQSLAAGPEVGLPVGVWVKVSVTTSLGSANNVGFRISGVPEAGGDVFEITGVSSFAGTSMKPFFDGDTPDNSVYDYAWTGTPGASESIQRTTVVPVAENLFSNPSFETSSGPTEIDRNLLVNPSFELTADGWYTSSAAVTAVLVGNNSYINPIGTNCLTVTATTADAIAAAGDLIVYSDYITCAAGDKIGVAGSNARVGGATPSTVRLAILCYNAAGSRLSTDYSTVSTISGAPPSFNRGTVTATAPATTVKFRVAWLADAPHVANAGYRFEGMQAHIIGTGDIPPYFDGSTPAGDDFTYRWLGAAHASASVKEAPRVPLSSGGAYPVQSSDWASSGTKSLRLVSGYFTASSAYSDFGAFVEWGNTYTIKGRVRIRETLDVAPMFTAFTTGGNPNYSVQARVTASGPASPGIYDLSLTFTMPAYSTGMQKYVRFYNNNSYGKSVWLDDLLLVAGDGSGQEYFSGDTPNNATYTHQWANTAHGSVSYKTALPAAGWMGYIAGNTHGPYKTAGGATFDPAWAATYLMTLPFSGVANGEFVTLKARVRKKSSVHTTFRIATYDGTYRADSGSVTVTATGDDWQEISTPATSAVAASGSIRAYLYAQGGPVEAQWVMAEKVPGVGAYSTTPYFDGNSADQAYKYAWTGAVDASTSTRTEESLSIPSTFSGQRAAFESNMRTLMRLFTRPHKLSTIRAAQPDGSVRRAQVEWAEWSEPEVMAGGTRAEFGMGFTIPGVWWEDENVTVQSATANATLPKTLDLTSFTGMTGIIEDAVLTVAGPITNPRITDVETGSFVQYTGTVAAGSTWTVDVPNSKSGVGVSSVLAQTTHAGNYKLFVIPNCYGNTDTPRLTLSGTGGGATTNLTVTARRKWATG